MSLFGCIHKIKLKMGFKANNIEVKKQTTDNKEGIKDLNKEELVFLLQVLKDTTFKGESVEILYNTILKLQNKLLKNDS